MRDNRRWQLTDLQRVLVALMVCVAAFLGAMAWGMRSFATLLVALAIVVVVGLGVFLLGLRYNSRPTGPGTAYVVTASTPPIGKIVARCDMTVLLDMPGAPAGKRKLRDPSVPTSKWPRSGDGLPADVDPHTRQVRIRWDLADPSQYRTNSPTPARQPSYEYTPTTEYIPTPAAIIDAEIVPPPRRRVFLDDDLALGPGPDADDAEFDLDATISQTISQTMTGDAAIADAGLTGTTITGTTISDTAVTATAVTETAATDAVPRERTTRDPDAPVPTPTPRAALGAGPAHTPVIEDGPAGGPAAENRTAPGSAAGDDSAGGWKLPTRTIPQPRPAEPDLGTTTRDGSGPGGAGMGGMLIVSDLARSIAFYRDLLGFTLVDQTSGAAVLAYGGGRVLLSQMADMSPVDRRVVHLHIEVSDVDASYAQLRNKGVEFVHRPRVMTRGERLELWAATLRDPDGHAIALTQWRDRQGAAH